MARRRGLRRDDYISPEEREFYSAFNNPLVISRAANVLPAAVDPTAPVYDPPVPDGPEPWVSRYIKSRPAGFVFGDGSVQPVSELSRPLPDK
ncbi:hypothetical protein UFOVP1339_4 [uncultured Caudovirales phage]|uniref:Uncharacterized protein n=1 Tax=uncultured Caudovirales phage TaxID=2100421 RepID=A0A6J5RQL6_9CAUD|nr:hypothetical protein UFOVP1339_4 [uncultured Caudovirales phage]